MPTLKITTIQCISPSTGVSGAWDSSVEVLGEVLGAVAGGAVSATVAAAVTSETGPFAALAATTVGAAGTTVGASIGDAFAKSTDSILAKIGQHIDDDLFVEFDHVKVWPSGKSHSIGAGEIVTLNVSKTFTQTIDVSLKEWDAVKNDQLGETVFDKNSKSGVYVFGNPKEQDLYSVSIEITP